MAAIDLLEQGHQNFQHHKIQDLEEQKLIHKLFHQTY